MLTEAAVIEHDLLCSYPYAAFSLKQGLDEELLAHELEAVGRWDDSIMQVCMEKMTHLAQVANYRLDGAPVDGSLQQVGGFGRCRLRGSFSLHVAPAVRPG